ncbi:lipid-A-disaccharide synthase [Solitalea canadensis]|uniref:Lipid-A-disaccharide synthase n=1 Tax=Solitalea canadensis (strain ATCC 29591 / DSM 3403 / JCM 21819 / LMG 8368 / NBRC 15130 / NCIMB 12057 / USAM 9D) TaxID=929556 RepID=H8KWA0_SOLCM|nr:lipid-A-disaccharide synthase [Solitalea canadensis]AFD07892.1 lipid-A-disaccharide synthase [Solitalea canadensis DSM 3403]
MKYYIIAGEASGDLHGSNLMKALKDDDSNAEFRFWGGDLMLHESENIRKHYKEMAFMGFVEVVVNLRKILSNLSDCKHDLLENRPDALILVDFPGFNLKIAEFAKRNGIKVYYYISPKVWAWNQKRVLKIKKVVDHMFCILPFEVSFYDKWGMKVDYVGNPLLDAISNYSFNTDFKSQNNLDDRPIVALLPGSRKQEIERLLPEMIKMIDHFPENQFVIAGAPTFTADYYDQYKHGANVPVVFNQTYDLLKNSEAAIVASGTATLETALLNVPQVVVYKGNPLSIAIAKLLVKIKYISLVNLIAEKTVVKELIQDDCNEKALNAELDLILNDVTYRSKMLQNYAELHSLMGEPGASERTAKLIIDYLEMDQ